MTRRRAWAIGVAIALLAALGVARWVMFRAADAAGARGMSHHANLRYDEAIADYTRASEPDVGNWHWAYYRALVHAERGEIAQAAELFRRVVAARPHHGLAWWRLGEAEFKQAHYDAADTAYARAEADASVAEYARRGRARVAAARGALPAAINPEPRPPRPYTPPRDPMVDALAELSQSSVFLLRHAAAIPLSADPGTRERIVRRALEVDPDNPEVVYELGALLQQLRRPSEALTYFTRHLEMTDDDQQTLVQIGKCYTDMGSFAQAEDALRRALQISDDAVGWFNLGVVMEERGRAPEAEHAYRRALAMDPSHASSHNNLAALLAERGRLQQAEEHWTMVLRVNPNHVDAHANLGAAFAQQGRMVEALRHLDEALRLDPNHKNARATRAAVMGR